jgi:hypothetical protein
MITDRETFSTPVGWSVRLPVVFSRGHSDAVPNRANWKKLAFSLSASLHHAFEEPAATYVFSDQPATSKLLSSVCSPVSQLTTTIESLLGLLTPLSKPTAVVSLSRLDPLVSGAFSHFRSFWLPNTAGELLSHLINVELEVLPQRAQWQGALVEDKMGRLSFVDLHQASLKGARKRAATFLDRAGRVVLDARMASGASLIACSLLPNPDRSLTYEKVCTDRWDYDDAAELVSAGLREANNQLTFFIGVPHVGVTVQLVQALGARFGSGVKIRLPDLVWGWNPVATLIEILMSGQETAGVFQVDARNFILVSSGAKKHTQI